MCVIVMVNCVGVDFYLDSFFHFCLLFILVVFACICMGKNSQVIGDSSRYIQTDRIILFSKL